MRLTSIGIAALASIVSGCSTLSYQEPQSGPRARVRFVTDTPEVSVLYAYDDAGCANNEREMMRLRAGPLVNSHVKKLGMPLWEYHQNAAKEVYIAVGQTVHFMFSAGEITTSAWVMTTSLCAVVFSHPFEADRDYEAILHWEPKNCHVVLNELTTSAGQTARTPIARFSNRITPENTRCKEQFTKKRLY